MLNLAKPRRRTLRTLVLVAFSHLFLLLSAKAQVTGSFTVQGTTGSYYPVTFVDGGWNSNVATVMTLGRSGVHDNSTWRGSLIARFTFHVSNDGNGAYFVDADLRQAETHPVTINNFVGGWTDVSVTNTSDAIVVWLMGGGTTYYYTANYTISPTVYDGVANALPYAVAGTSTTLGAKTTPDGYVNNTGITTNGSLFALGAGSNYMAGALSIGTVNPQGYALAVNGSAIFTQAVVKNFANWPDYVFGSDYRPMPMDSLECYIGEYHHLPDIPSASEIGQKGLDLGAMERLHMQKIEELTLYAIDADKRVSRDEELIAQQRAALDRQQTVLVQQQSLLSRVQAQLKVQQQEIDRLKGRQ